MTCFIFPILVGATSFKIDLVFEKRSFHLEFVDLINCDGAYYSISHSNCCHNTFPVGLTKQGSSECSSMCCNHAFSYCSLKGYTYAMMCVPVETGLISSSPFTLCAKIRNWNKSMRKTLWYYLSKVRISCRHFSSPFLFVELFPHLAATVKAQWHFSYLLKMVTSDRYRYI